MRVAVERLATPPVVAVHTSPERTNSVDDDKCTVGPETDGNWWIERSCIVSGYATVHVGRPTEVDFAVVAEEHRMIESSSLEDPWQCTVSKDDLDIVADTTTDHGGSGEGIRPRELLEGALATCMNMTVRMAADRDGIDLDCVRTVVDLDRSGDRETFRYVIECEGVTESEAEQLRAAAEHCPVHGTLSEDVTFEERAELL